jgi:hypothetical protein
MKEYNFEIQDILTIGLVLVVTGIALAIGLQIMGDIKDDVGDNACSGYWNSGTQVCQVNTTNTTALSTNPAEHTAITNGITGVAKLPEKMPLIATVVVAAIILGILVRYLFVRMTR